MLRFALVVVSMVAASASAAGGVSQCPVEAVPIQIVNVKKSGPVTSLSAAKISGSRPQFRSFVRAVTEHVAARLVRDQLCIDGAESKRQSLLQFVGWEFADERGKEFLAPALSMEARLSGGCRISSPWIDIVFERRPDPWIRGVVRWNERQLLADQAVLAGARNVPTGLAMPLQLGEYGAFEDDYERSELLGRPASKPIEERIPPDLLWLFRHSWQSTRAPFGAYVGGAMGKAVEKNAEPYTKLIFALIDRCFASDGAEFRYSSILDVADLISLEQYKIDTLLTR